jgi:hypothetical protein
MINLTHIISILNFIIKEIKNILILILIIFYLN